MKLGISLALYILISIVFGALNIYAWVFTYGWMNLILYSLGGIAAFGLTGALAWRWRI